MSGNLKLGQSPATLDQACVWGTLELENHKIVGRTSFEKLRFPPTRKQKAGAFKFHWFEERLRKAPFS